ncbi:MAG: hypothetical protein WCC03_02380, partial [Candidatus Acidiferrales bacterium]
AQAKPKIPGRDPTKPDRRFPGLRTKPPVCLDNADAFIDGGTEVQRRIQWTAESGALVVVEREERRPEASGTKSKSQRGGEQTKCVARLLLMDDNAGWPGGSVT